MSSIIIYGAYGFTGTLISELAVQKGLQPIIAGRDPKKTEGLANRLNLPWEAFDLDDRATLDRLLRNAELIINCAGPYSATAKQVIEACIRQKCNYIDITGEWEVFEYAASQSDAANEAGIVLIPGCGFDVVPTDCLALLMKRALPDAQHLEMAFKGSGSVSRGTALTMVEGLDKGGLIRENGKLLRVPGAFKTRKIDFGNGPRTAMSIPWGDVSTAYYTTGIPNITVYLAAKASGIRMVKLMNFLKPILKANWVKQKLKAYINNNVKGPDATIMEKGKTLVWAEVSNKQGKTITARLITPEAYKLTATTAVKAAMCILENHPGAGFKTPAMAFGPNFILDIEGVSFVPENQS